MRVIRFLTNWTLYNLHILPDRRAVPRDEPGLGERVVWSMRLGTVCIVLSASPRLAQADQVSCAVSAADLNFGGYSTVQTAPTLSATMLTLNCNRQHPVQIMLGASAISGSYTVRQMQHVSRPDRLEYNVYKDAAHSSVWGPRGSSKDHVKPAGASSQVAVYGRIAPGQDVAPGEYRDVLTVTIEP